MATRKNTRAAKARSRRLLPTRNEALERIHLELVGVKAAAMTAIIALHGRGVDDEISLSLRRHVLMPVEAIIDALDGRAQ